MGSLKERSSDQKSRGGNERLWITAEVGLILMDSSLRPIAFNREAAAILNYPEPVDLEKKTALRVPDEVVANIRSQSLESLASSVTYFRAGRRQYACHAYIMKSCDESCPQPAIALLLQRNPSATEAVYEVAAEFHLTEREREALKGISMGLTIKELAKEMAISPHTVKAYLRFIMVKMGVSTRAAIVAKILEHSNGGTGKTPPIGPTNIGLRARA
jgi:DNA-binding CsgD family transcriptional regulator